MRNIEMPDEAELLALAETPLRRVRVKDRKTYMSDRIDAPAVTLNYGDNGYQQFFVGDNLLLFNPYLGDLSAAEKLSYGWQAAQRHAGNWHALLDSVPRRDLYGAKALLEATLHVSVTLSGEPVGVVFDQFADFPIRREGAAIELARTLTLEQYLVPMPFVDALPFTIDSDARTQVFCVGRDVLLDDDSVVTIAGFGQRGKHTFIKTWLWRKEPDLLPEHLAYEFDEYRRILKKHIRGVLVDEIQLTALSKSLPLDILVFSEKMPSNSIAGQPGNWWQVETRQAHTPIGTDTHEVNTKTARAIPALVDWLAQKHSVQRSGSDSYYIQDDGARVLWAGVTSRWAVIVKQHHALVRSALRWQNTEPVDIPPSVYVEYPDLAEYAGATVDDVDILPAWALSKAVFVNLADTNRKSRTYAHKHIVETALVRGYDVPLTVLSTYPDLAKKYGFQLSETSPSIEANPPAEANPPVQEKTPPPSDIVKTFKRWELHLLTGMVNRKRNSAFNRALSAIKDPAVLDYALSKIAPGDTKRRTAITQRLQKINASI